MDSKKRKKRKKTFLNVSITTWYHILFWVIVVALFPISISVWFYRNKKINMTPQAKKIAIAVLWGVIALCIALAIIIPGVKKRAEEKAASKQESLDNSKAESEEASKQESIAASLEEAAKSKMTIEFFDMGQADAILISCEDHYMIIDSGDLSVSLSAKVLERGVETVDYVVASTANNESVGGFARAMNRITVQKAFCVTTEGDSDKFNDFKNALTAQNVELTVPTAGDTYELGSAKITFLGPVANAAENVNSSLVILIEHQGSKFLFMGYADAVEEQEILASGVDLSGTTMIKVGHHGSSTGTSTELLNAAQPQYGVISVGEGYGYPSDETLGRLYDAGVKTYRTDMQGSIVCESVGGTLTFTVEGDANADTLGRGEVITTEPVETTENVETQPAESTDAPVVVNPTTDPNSATIAPPETNALGWKYAREKGTNIFHRLNCSQLTNSGNTEYYTESREELLGWNFIPCTVCNP